MLRAGGHRLPFPPNTRPELTFYDALSNRHQGFGFVGAPELGRLALVRVRYDS